MTKPDTIYRQRILDHYKNPRNYGQLETYTHTCGFRNVGCADQLQFWALVRGGKIRNIAFTGQGCAISIASASLVSDYIRNKPLSVIGKLDKVLIEQLLGIKVSPARESCATTSLEALKKLQKASKRRDSKH